MKVTKDINVDGPYHFTDLQLFGSLAVAFAFFSTITFIFIPYTCLSSGRRMSYELSTGGVGWIVAVIYLLFSN
jgi:hypothetical protein